MPAPRNAYKSEACMVLTTAGQVDLKLRAQRSPGGTGDCPFARGPDEERPAAVIRG